ncbi:4Fe-4S dicluster domain-containing protein [Candidatus Acetothermia bacterium]|nr:4Fe-4S dicluster domain-containing protein [Candidatus Acetothermia bacterium]MBI3644295.1 4Fe-4S dicluster domain-containing protein [Candidatus Acetothermia bacterium]
MAEKSQVIERDALDDLLKVLREQGYEVIGPTIQESAIVYDRIDGVSDMPVGWTDVQDGGSYRLKKRTDESRFGYVVGPHSWKKFLFPPELRLWRAKRDDAGFKILEEREQTKKYAFIGVRSCELHAIFIQDRVFMGGKHVDPVYKSRREKIFIVAVNCAEAGGTCFCVSMKTGPKAQSGYDLALTEIVERERHYFTVEVGSERGQEVLKELQHREAKHDEISAAEGRTRNASEQMGRTMDINDLKELLYRNYNHERWENVAERCLSCANCTMVCPTCFCTTVEDVTDLTGQYAERLRRWDSCFTIDFSYIHGGSLRKSAKSRYRQWMTHKLATWIDQFGTSGCVGCGRCITWCPVGIDITEEVKAIRESEGGTHGDQT